MLQAEGALECAVELYSLTKSFSMAGWRVGFTIGRPDVVAALAKIKSYLDYGTFQPIQIASIVALREAADYPAEVCEIYRGRRDALCSGLGRAGWHIEPPKGTMFVWAPIPEQYAELGSLEFALKLAREADVAVSPGIGFGPGGDGHVRFALVENEQRINQATRNDPPTAAGSGSRGDRSFRRRADVTRVLGEDALARSFGAGADQPASRLASSSSEISRFSVAALDVERDRVAVAHRRDRAAVRRLRRDVADHQAVRRAREAAVGDQRDLLADALADERAGHVQHLAHARAAGRALVADHDHVAGLDLRAPSRPRSSPPRSRTRAPGR